MKRTWPIIGVQDVQASSAWYRELLGCKNNHPGKDSFDQLLDTDGTVLLCLHLWGEHENHPTLISPNDGQLANGLLLYFCVDDFDEALSRARSLVASLEEEPHENPNARALEFSLRDLDGYYVTISAFDLASLR